MENQERPLRAKFHIRAKCGGGGGAKRHPLEIKKKSVVRPYVAKSYFETFKSYDPMQKIRPISQDYNQILAFKKVEKMRFCHTLTYEDINTHSLFPLSIFTLTVFPLHVLDKS